MKNLLQLKHEYFAAPDDISVYLNDLQLYRGPADTTRIDFSPVVGSNTLRVILDHKHPGNWQYDSGQDMILKDSKVTIQEIIVEDRYLRSLTTKCGLVEINLEKNLNFPSKYIDHENCLTMEGSVYLIKIEFPIKHWIQIHLHGRNLNNIQPTNQQARQFLASHTSNSSKTT